MAAGMQRAHPPQDRIIIHGPLDILESFPDEGLQGLHRTQQASRTQSSSNRPHVTLAPRGRGGFGASTKDVGYATRYVQRHSKGDPRIQKRALAQAGMAVVARRNPSGADEGGAVMRPCKGGMDDSEEDKHGYYCHVPERTSVDHQATRQSDASGYGKQPSATWSFRPSAVRHTLPHGCYDVRTVDRASSGYDTVFHGDGNPIGFDESSRAGISPNTRPGNDEQRCWKGPECYHRGPENSSASDDCHHCRVDGDDDGLPFDARDGYGEGYAGEAEMHHVRSAKGPELRQRCRRSTELGPGRRCCDLQEVKVAHYCAGRRPRRRSIRDEGDCVDTWCDGSGGKEEREIPSNRCKQSHRRRDWSPEDHTSSAVPTGRRLWTRGDEEEKPRPQMLNEALVQRPSDMLLFSKKARPVEYKPCTLKEYRETKPTAYMELGKLQPDLHTEELVAKRANAERVKEFSEKLRQINSDATARRRKSHTAPTKPVVQDARSRALAFARLIPPPRPTKAKPSAKGRD